jgi:hypothetical protein
MVSKLTLILTVILLFFKSAFSSLRMDLAAREEEVTRLRESKRLRRERSHTPLRVMILCPQTGKEVFTGVELAPAEFESMGISGMEVSCPHCMGTHRWDKSSAFLEAA